MRRPLSLVLVMVLLMGAAGCARDPAHTTQPSQTDAPGQTTVTQAPNFTEPTTVPGITETIPPHTTELTEPIITAPVVPGYSDNTFVRVKDYIPDIKVELRYASDENFTGRAIYDFYDAYLRYGTVKKLMKVQEALRQQGLSLKIWDAFRPASAQTVLWEAFPNADYVSNPSNGYSSHTRGGTVDVTLVDSSGKELNMPSDYDVFSPLGDRDYSDCADEAAANARLLENLMRDNGFSAYEKEWWHFSDTTAYATDTDFDPAVVSLWYANCSTYLSLRKSASASAKELGRVPAGESVILLGWYDKFAYVDYLGTQGYVSSDYLKPEDAWLPNEMLSIVRETETYTYEQMQLDIAALAKKYPSLLQVGSIGTSELGRDLTLLVMGDPDAKYHVIIHGSMHAREHMTTWMVMAMTEYWLSRNMAGCEDVCFHIIPMVNPDGVYLAQTADFTEEQLAIYNWDKANGYTSLGKAAYAANWKANGLGVDINRNFDAAWKTTSSRAKPSTERYKGEAPCSSAEAAAIASYTLALMPDVTISCHSTGSILYYEYGKKPVVNAASKSLGKAVQAIGGYRMVGQGGLDAAGYKDWSMDVLEIPALTIEMGCGACPLPLREIYSIFARNLRVMPAVAKWLERQV